MAVPVLVAELDTQAVPEQIGAAVPLAKHVDRTNSHIIFAACLRFVLCAWRPESHRSHTTIEAAQVCHLGAFQRFRELHTAPEPEWVR